MECLCSITTNHILLIIFYILLSSVFICNNELSHGQQINTTFESVILGFLSMPLFWVGEADCLFERQFCKKCETGAMKEAKQIGTLAVYFVLVRVSKHFDPTILYLMQTDTLAV